MTVKELNIIVGQNIRHYRKLKGWYAKDLAKKIGVNKWMISKYERGNTFPHPLNLLLLASVLCVEVYQLFYKNGENNNDVK